jgi:hypothetical protein
MKRKNFRRFAAVGAIAVILGLWGCKPPAAPIVCGPPLAKGELIALNNANAAKVPSLRASADVEIRFRDEKEEEQHYRARDGFLRLLKDPQNPQAVPSFLLVAQMVSEAYFAAGVDSAAGDYYYWIDAPTARVHPEARWGQLADLHRPGYESLPVDPVDLLYVLPVLPWPQNDPAHPVFVVPKDDPCLYDVIFFTQGGGQTLQLRRQMWMDRTVVPARLTHVWIMDPEGRVTVDANLADYRKIKDPNLPASQWPEMPTDITLRYPQEKKIASLRLRLTNLTVGTKDEPVRPAMFRRQSVIPSRIEDQRALGPLKESPLDAGSAVSQPAESRPTQSRPVESQPAEPQPAVSPAEGQAAASQPAQTGELTP